MSNIENFDFEDEITDFIPRKQSKTETPYPQEEIFDFPPVDQFENISDYGVESSFFEEILKTPERITVDGFRRKCKYWDDIFNDLEVFDEQKIRNEIQTWDLTIPGDNEFDLNVLAAAYALTQSYMVRVTHLIGIVNQHVHAYEYASKELKLIAQGLSDKTAKVADKAAHAAYVTEPITRRLAKVAPFHAYLVLLKDTIKNGGDQMARINKERETDMRFNQSMMIRGNDVRNNSYEKPAIKARPLFNPPPPDPLDLED